MQDIDRQLDASHNRRMARDAKFLARNERREDAADAMIGELCKVGEVVYYVWPVGGRYREGTRAELIAFLLRNNYV